MNKFRQNIRNAIRSNETDSLKQLLKLANLGEQERALVSTRAAGLVRDIRAHSKPGIMEIFLEELRPVNR